MTLKERFDDFINECYGDVRIGCLTYTTAEVLKAVDPIAYNEWKAEFETQEQDLEDEQ